MPNVLTHPTDAELAAAVEGNLFDLFRSMMALSGSDFVEAAKLSCHHAFPTNPMFKGVWNTHLNPANADDSIDEVLDWFKVRGAPFVFWWTSDRTEPPDMPKRLIAHGFTVNMVGDPGMAADLNTLNEKIQAPDGFRMVTPEDQKGLEDWRDVFCASFAVPAFAGQAWVDATLALGATNAPWRFYVGYLDDKPVASNILFNGAGVASVYGVGTVPEARGKGIGAAITLKPFLDARAMGYRFGVLFSTEMGHAVYRRLGFHDVDCKVGRYMWVNPGS